VVELPVGATEDRVVGTMDMELALKQGEKRVEPGILASAHRGILYVVEVNLLDDHVVDVLLDAAAMGVNTIEREGVSFSHPARFTLVGRQDIAKAAEPALPHRIRRQPLQEIVTDVEGFHRRNRQMPSRREDASSRTDHSINSRLRLGTTP